MIRFAKCIILDINCISSRSIERIKFQSTSDCWGYFSVGANGGIHEFADSQFGHLFAKGATREQARKSLVLALKEIEVRGEIRTTRSRHQRFPFIFSYGSSKSDARSSCPRSLGGSTLRKIGNYLGQGGPWRRYF